MPQSLARMYVHLVFSTKYRRPFLVEAVRPSLHAYMATLMKDIGCHPVNINSVADHIHILFDLSRTISLSKAVEKVKKSSSKWIKTQHSGLTGFSWQGGYGAFSVSESHKEKVRRYIDSQERHHRMISFKDELRGLLNHYGIEYDERYIWE